MQQIACQGINDDINTPTVGGGQNTGNKRIIPGVKDVLTRNSKFVDQIILLLFCADGGIYGRSALKSDRNSGGSKGTGTGMHENSFAGAQVSTIIQGI